MLVMTQLLLSILLSVSPTHADTFLTFHDQIDSAFEVIMQTSVGRGICRHILGADAANITFHLGVSPAAAEKIAADCATGDAPETWIFGSNANIRKLSITAGRPRSYESLQAEKDFPIESWTDPFTNTTTLIMGKEGLTYERLVQLLAHEMAVYFDSKANPAHADALLIPEIRDLKIENAGKFNPLLAVSDPLIAHTMTYIRALQVEFKIVEELVEQAKISPPPDFHDRYLNYLISAECRQDCLMRLISHMREKYLPIGLPLLAFSPQFRMQVTGELVRFRPNWSEKRWSRVQEIFNSYPVEFLKSQFTGNTLADIQNVFEDRQDLSSAEANVSQFLNEILWPLEKAALVNARVNDNETFLEYMKTPLLSGANVLFSSGPRVRIGTGNIE